MNRQAKPAQPEDDFDADAPLVLDPIDNLGEARPSGKGTTPAQFLREVRGEMRKVAWPNRAEVVNYSTVVLVTLVLIIALIFGLNYAFAKGVTFLFHP
ncbi:MAG: preprotein translocase subunit SecE [Acidimicrobiales bacterium]